MPDLIGIVSFNDEASSVLPLCPVTTHEALLAAHRMAACGTSNLAAALQMAHHWLVSLPWYILRRAVIISDGQPTGTLDKLPMIASQMRNDYISLDAIYCGDADDTTAQQILHGLCAATVGGHYGNASTTQAVADLVTRAPPRRYHRQAATVLMIDTSGSMNERLNNSTPGDIATTRLQAAVAAAHALVVTKRHAFGGL